jgi:hypothetical protein
MNATIIEEWGSYLLIARGDHFAVVERRNHHLYNCHGGRRNGTATDDLSTIAEVVDETDWVDEVTAQRAFDEAVSRYAELAEHMR